MTPDHFEERLIMQAMRGNAAAFSDLYRRYLEAAFRYFYFRVGNVVAAEQLADRLFVRAWESLPADPELRTLPFKIWLFRLADQLVSDYNDFLENLRLPDDRPPLMAWSPNTPSAKLPRLHPRILALAVRHLDPLAQQVLVLRFLLLFSPKEVALVVGDTEAGAHVLQYRAISSLCETITRRQMKDNLFTGEHIDSTNFCLDHLISGTRTIEGCLEHLPEYNEQLKERLQFGQMVVDARHVKPRREFVQDMRKRIEHQLGESRRPPVLRSRPFGQLTRMSFTPPNLAAVLVALSIILAAGLATAVGLQLLDEATPTSRLYRLDLGAEQVYLATLRDPDELVRYRLSLTEERLEEVEAVASHGDQRAFQTALLAYALQVSALSQEVGRVGTSELSATVDETFGRQEQQLSNALSALLEPASMDQVGQNSGTVSCAEGGASTTWHPAGLTFVVQHGANLEDVRGWACEGYTFGAIVLAVATGYDGQISVQDALTRKQEVGSWSQVWTENNSTP